MSDGEQPDEERRENIRDILDEYQVQDYQQEEQEISPQVQSKEYQTYKAAEARRRNKHWYIRLVDTLGVYDIDLGKRQVKINQATDLMSWEFDTNKIFSAAGIAAFVVFLVALGIFVIDAALGLNIPTVFKAGSMFLPFMVMYYLIQYPVFQAQRKVINSSDELILSLLYMVIYMRNSPNIEGAVRFAALNTTGEVSDDLKHTLWQVEVGTYTTIEEALVNYAEKWRPYNRDFIQSMELLVEATAEGNSERRETILAESINNLLDGTREKMKRYARELRMPVSATFGMGILLPVLGMILFPLVASFMGGGSVEIYLSFTYNVLIPVMIYVIVYHTLMRRPPTVSTQDVDSELLPKKGWYTMEVSGREVSVPAILPAAVFFLVIGAWPLMYYFSVLTGNAMMPPHVETRTDVTPISMLRTLTLTFAASVSIGLYMYLGNVQRLEKFREIGKLEEEFPEALFQLGNTLNRGTPVETGVRKALNNMGQLEITDMFRIISYNMNEVGMTFEQAIFDENYGALRHYPSQLIESVMRALTRSSQKGTRIVAKAMMSISTYLKNIYATEEEIQEQLGETLATMSFLGFVLAPVISGVALGLGTIITKSFYMLELFESCLELEGDLGDVEEGSAGGVGGQAPAGFEDGGFSTFSVEAAVPPDVLQLVIGLYLIELSLLIGMFYVRLTEGENAVVQRVFTGKVLIVTPILYGLTTLLLVVIFGNMISGAIVEGITGGC